MRDKTVAGRREVGIILPHNPLLVWEFDSGRMPVYNLLPTPAHPPGGILAIKANSGESNA
jgi:hypothetical protein